MVNGVSHGLIQTIHGIIFLMPRQPRIDIGDTVYHVINRANARAQIFNTDKDYQLFEQLLQEAQKLTDMRILAYTIMPNHWHLVLHPVNDGDLQQFMKWLTNTHTRKWHTQHKTIGSGHLYQGRYKSFIVQKDSYLLQLIRYVERNALCSKLVKQAQDWKWSSLWRREKGTEQQKKLISELPIDIPQNYINWVNAPDDDTITKEIRHCVNKGKPFGDDKWTLDTIERYNLFSTARGSGRPKNLI